MDRNESDAIILDVDLLYPMAAALVRCSYIDRADEFMQDVAIQFLDPYMCFGGLNRYGTLSIRRRRSEVMAASSSKDNPKHLLPASFNEAPTR